MADFPRTIMPDKVSPLWAPTGLRSRAHTGRITTRASTQVGWTWTESFVNIPARSVDTQEFMAYLQYAFNRMIEFEISHLLSPGSGKPRNGVGTPAGNILVNGADQLGDALNTDGWPVSTVGVVRGGDLIEIGSRTYMVRESADSDAAGACSIPVVPNIFSSPVNNAAVAYQNVKISAMIWSLPQWPKNVAPDFYSGDIVFAEVLP